MLEKEYAFYQKNQQKLLKKYKDKVLVIKGEEVVGVYDNEATAYEVSISRYNLGTFLIQKCIEDKKEAAQTFHSRVIFV